MNAASFQEEIFVRRGIFKREVLKQYNFTCCISGLRIDSNDNVSLVDACHIEPFSESYNDTITNGIVLCPNLHRAFDRGLIFINDDYSVHVNNNFTEQYQSAYNIKQFNNTKIQLPLQSEFYPSIESLYNHRKRFALK